MLVRWQYWQASAKMFADHPLTGVGPGNFASFYTRYKPAAALESVADPHNFPLSILTQYGPLGLIGFLVMIFIPLWKALSPAAASPLPRIDQPQPAFRTLALTLLIIISLALLFVRPLLMPPPPADTIEVVIYLILTLYITPAAVFFIAFLLLPSLYKQCEIRFTIHDSQTTSHEPRFTSHESLLSLLLLSAPF
jgi:O-antigen ligase